MCVCMYTFPGPTPGPRKDLNPGPMDQDRTGAGQEGNSTRRTKTTQLARDGKAPAAPAQAQRAAVARRAPPRKEPSGKAGTNAAPAAVKQPKWLQIVLQRGRRPPRAKRPPALNRPLKDQPNLKNLDIGTPWPAPRGHAQKRNGRTAFTYVRWLFVVVLSTSLSVRSLGRAEHTCPMRSGCS